MSVGVRLAPGKPPIVPLIPDIDLISDKVCIFRERKCKKYAYLQKCVISLLTNNSYLPVKQWFETWFDSPYYHKLYANRSEAEAADFISLLAKHLGIPPNAKVIDIACGKGRHTRTLAKLGFDATGIDLSPNSIAHAAAQAKEHLRFEVWDMRVPFRENYFDVAFNLFSSFGYFDDDAEDAKAIQAMFVCLKPSGLLVLDYINTQHAVKNLKSREIVPREDIQFHVQKKIENGFIKKQINFLAAGEEYEFQEQLKVINLARFERMIAEAGFELVEVLGSYSLEKFAPTTSPRLILIAKKR